MKVNPAHCARCHREQVRLDYVRKISGQVRKSKAVSTVSHGFSFKPQPWVAGWASLGNEWAVSHINLFLSKLRFVRVFYNSNRRQIRTMSLLVFLYVNTPCTFVIRKKNTIFTTKSPSICSVFALPWKFEYQQKGRKTSHSQWWEICTSLFTFLTYLCTASNMI